MSNSPQNPVVKAQAEMIDSIKSYQGATLRTIRAWSDAFDKVTPKTPVVELPDDMKPAVVDPVEVVDLNYRFAREVLDLNRTFSLQLIEAMRTGRPTAAPDAAD